MPSDNIIPDSTYPPLERPEFKSQIPAYLLESASDRDRFIIEQLNILTQFIPWSVEAHISINEMARKTNGKIIRAEVDIEKIKTDRKSEKKGWKFIFLACGVVAGFISFIVTIIEGLYYLGIVK